VATAIRRGEVTREQVELLLDQFAAAVRWHLVRVGAVDSGYLDQLTDLLVGGVTGS
jgi:hypothetical protein